MNPLDHLRLVVAFSFPYAFNPYSLLHPIFRLTLPTLIYTLSKRISCSVSMSLWISLICNLTKTRGWSQLITNPNWCYLKLRIVLTMWTVVGLCLIALLVTYTIRWIIKWRNPNCNGVLPPGSMGLPLIGETLNLIIPSYSLDLHPFIKKRLEK